ncbi:MAG: acetyl-CoA carboxylase carboxyltransferase subunit alpha [Candidatus Sumerlaeota bacterium]
MATQTFEFENPLVEVEEQIEDLQEQVDDEETPEEEKAELKKQITVLKREHTKLSKDIYGNLSAWERVQIARHMERPRSLDVIQGIMTEWEEIKGDRNFRDDPAVVCGIARLDGEPVMVIGQQKGHNTNENVERNFGMMHPEGYRKAIRAMRIAERFEMPIIILIDTPGAYPGIGAEERGQSEAIARNIMEMFEIRTPIIGLILGEGASGGALGVGVVDHMAMLENSWYCVISPEGCASILWRDAANAPEAATVLRLTAKDLQELGINDETIEEPLGGAHKDPKAAMEAIRKALIADLKRLKKKNIDSLLEERFAKYRKIGVYAEGEA